MFKPQPTTSDLQQESGTEKGSKNDFEYGESDDDDTSVVFTAEAEKPCPR